LAWLVEFASVSQKKIINSLK